MQRTRERKSGGLPERGAELREAIELFFFAYRAFTAGPDRILDQRGLSRVHHRILYFAHFTPGITVSTLLAVLGVKHQNIQPPLRQLVQEGYILTRASEEDGRVKQLYCSRKGDKLLEFVSGPQRERIQRGYDGVTRQDVESYFKVMTAMLDGPAGGESRAASGLDSPLGGDGTLAIWQHLWRSVTSPALPI